MQRQKKVKILKPKDIGYVLVERHYHLKILICVHAQAKMASNALPVETKSHAVMLQMGFLVDLS